MKKALKIGIMGMIGFMLFVYGGLKSTIWHPCSTL